jgi:polar amino acid transport system substrate-binding protein
MFWEILFSSFLMTALGAPPASVKLVTGVDFRPLVDQRSPNGGTLVELTKKAFAQSGYQTSVDFIPWTRGANKVAESEYDATFPYVKSKQREEQFFYSDVIYNSVSRLFFSKRKSLKSFSQIKGLTLCRPVGWDLEGIQEFLKKHELKLVQPSELKDCFAMLEKGRVDVVPVAEDLGWKMIEDHPQWKAGFNTLDPAIDEVKYYLIVGKKNPRAKEILAAFNEGLRKLKAL